MSLNRNRLAVSLALAITLIASATFADALMDPKLNVRLSTANATQLISAVITYKSGPSAADVTKLRLAGIQYGVVMKALPMAGVWANPAQIRQLAGDPNVKSIYLNAPLKYFNREGSALIGASEQRTMAGFGYSGRGIGVAIVDSGIDGTHADLPYPSHVKQNVKVIVGGAGLGSPFDGVVPPVYAEGVADTDTTSGHGTHAAGSIAGLGTQSGGKYAGVAPGADLIGVSTGEAIAILWAIEGFDYVLTHQYLYNIRVVSNSWGTSGPFDPNDPVSVASKVLHDRGMTVVFAAGNEGPGNNTLNPYSVAPWVIGVAAGDKKARLADFSSRGLMDDSTYHPTITAPGVDIVSVKAPLTPLGNAEQCPDGTLTTAETPYYACMSGTSMATPHVAGACALLLEANPALSPDQIKSIMSATATPMAGYKQYQDGAGYLNVLAGIDLATNPSKTYGAVLNQNYNSVYSGSVTDESFDQDFSPLGNPPSHSFTVAGSGIQSDIFITWDNLANTFNLAATAPNGAVTSTGSNALAAVYGLQASLAFDYPAAGNWTTTVYGLKGQSTGTIGIGVPDTIHQRIINYYGTFTGLDDISGSPYRSYIRRAVMMRLMDSTSGTTFSPDAAVLRGEAAQMIASDCWVRQSQLAPLSFADVPTSLAPYVQAMTSAGGPMRDTFMQSRSIMDSSSSTFNPNATVSRADLATWLVRALGMESDALANMNTATTFSDDASIPKAARGYVVVASNIGLMPGFYDSITVEGEPATLSWQPMTTVTRGAFALTIGRWYDIFMAP